MEMRFTYNSDRVAMYRAKTLSVFERMIEVAWSKPEIDVDKLFEILE